MRLLLVAALVASLAPLAGTAQAHPLVPDCQAPSSTQGLQGSACLSGGGVDACASGMGASVCLQASGLCLPPRFLRASLTAQGLLLQWDAPLDGAPQEYAIYRAEGPALPLPGAGRMIALVSGQTTSYFDFLLPGSPEFTYWVTAVGPCESASSNSVDSEGLPPNVFDCVYPDVVVPPIPPDTSGAYVGLDCLSLGTGLP